MRKLRHVDILACWQTCHHRWRKSPDNFLLMIVQSCDIHEVEQLNPSSQNWLKGKFEGHSFFRGKTNCFWFQFLTNQSIAFRFLGITKNILELDGPGMAVTSNSYGPMNQSASYPMNQKSRIGNSYLLRPKSSNSYITLDKSDDLSIFPSWETRNLQMESVGKRTESPPIFPTIFQANNIQGPAGKLQLPGASPSSSGSLAMNFTTAG